MCSELRSLGLKLRRWVEAVVGLITLCWFLGSDLPLSVKLGAIGVLLLGAYTIVVVGLTALRTRVHHGRCTRDLEREVRHLRQTLEDRSSVSWLDEKRRRQANRA